MLLSHSIAMHLSLLLLLVAAAYGHLDFEIHKHNSNIPACVEAECSEKELCLIKAGEATCVPVAALKEYVKLHQKKHDHHKEEHQVHKHLTAQEHAKHDGIEECSEAELAKIGGRLLAWFDAIHSQNAGADKSLPKHHVVCRPSAAWMFLQWDGNNDGYISQEEAKPMENVKCTAQYLDKCDDMVVDGKISLDEWCDCFSFADGDRHEPPCHKAKHAVDPHLQGAMIPRCDLEGFYRPEQCHEGQCWCVDKYGREFDHSRVSAALPDCGQYGYPLSEEEAHELHARL